MGIISGSVLQHGGSVTAVIPAAMLRAGGEGERTSDAENTTIQLDEAGREKVKSFSAADQKYILRANDASSGLLHELGVI